MIRKLQEWKQRASEELSSVISRTLENMTVLVFQGVNSEGWHQLKDKRDVWWVRLVVIVPLLPALLEGFSQHAASTCKHQHIHDRKHPERSIKGSCSLIQHWILLKHHRTAGWLEINNASLKLWTQTINKSCLSTRIWVLYLLITVLFPWRFRTFWVLGVLEHQHPDFWYFNGSVWRFSAC